MIGISVYINPHECAVVGAGYTKQGRIAIMAAEELRPSLHRASTAILRWGDTTSLVNRRVVFETLGGIQSQGGGRFGLVCPIDLEEECESKSWVIERERLNEPIHSAGIDRLNREEYITSYDRRKLKSMTTVLATAIADGVIHGGDVLGLETLALNSETPQTETASDELDVVELDNAPQKISVLSRLNQIDWTVGTAAFDRPGTAIVAALASLIDQMQGAKRDRASNISEGSEEYIRSLDAVMQGVMPMGADWQQKLNDFQRYMA